MKDIHRIKEYLDSKAMRLIGFETHVFISSAECIIKLARTFESDEFICIDKVTKYTCSRYSHLVLFTTHLILDTKPFRFIDESFKLKPYLYSIDKIDLIDTVKSLEICVGIFDDIAGFVKLFDIYKNAYPDRIKRICELLLERNECSVSIKAIILNALKNHNTETDIVL